MKPRIAITLGDFNGIGPEITLKAITMPSIQRLCNPVLVGSLDVYEWYARRLRLKIIFKEVDSFPFTVAKNTIPVVHLRKFHRPSIQPGILSKQAGAYAGEAIIAAAEFCLAGAVEGMVTAPVSKETMRMAGYQSPGQTELLASLTKTKRFMMMLAAEKLRVGLATVHTPLKNVSRMISKSTLLERFQIINHSLKNDFGIRSPKIAVLGLNPHAGEHGLIGQEEQATIIPAIRSANAKSINVEGPFPADGFFGRHTYSRYDAVIAMYHDQGLVPLKMKGFDLGVNITLGLPIVRTSPDHGTAFDIAGKGIANPGSMAEAIKLAVSIIKHRQRNILRKR